MKVAVYSPYLDTAGGGEKYMMTIATILSQKESVDVLLDTHLIMLDLEIVKKRILDLHGIDLSGIKFIKAPFGIGSNIWSRLAFLKDYDLFIFLTDGSTFFSSAKRNIVHFQVPFTNIDKVSLVQRIKLFS